MSITIGADPELFLRDVFTGRFVSAETQDGPIIPGTKDKPFEVRGGAIQVDGVAAEFNINPSSDFKSYYKNLKNVVMELNKRVKSYNENLRLSPVPTATFDKRYFDALPTHTKVLGCEPDFSAYTGAPNPRPHTNEPFRTGSGHIHIGWTKGVDPTSEGHMLDCCLVAKQLDKYLHFASMTWDTDKKRQELYGKPGSFRPKSYGMEYRPLSNAWLKSPELMRNVYLMTVGVMRSLESGRHDLEADLSKGFGETNMDKVLNSLGGFTYDL